MKTGLRIVVLEGQTVDGRTEYDFPASPREPEERIVIGRDPDHCRVVFVDDLRHHGLGNEHVAFRRSLGRYQLDLNTQNAVLVDGRKTFEEKELRGTHVLQLGDAVRLEVTVVDDRTATIGDDDDQQPHEVTLKNQKLLVGLAATVAALAIGGLWLSSRQERLQQETARVVGETAVPGDALERTARSVYLIAAKSDAGGEDVAGTGWSGPGGVIVTNAHVAEEISSSPEGVHWFVRAATPPYREHAVTSHRIHPGYDAFRKFVVATKPMQETIEKYSDVGQVPACDVAVLEVEDGDALAPPLPIPTREELKALKAGDPVAIVGFPVEGLAATPVVMSAPVPVRHRGFLVRVTDFFIREREDGMNQLVQHAIPVTGGSSGSPIIDARGRVIAVHNGGNTLGATESGRIISQVVSYGQRADLVLDLLEKTETKQIADYRRTWQGSLADFERGADVQLAFHVRETAEIMGRPDARPTTFRKLPGQAVVARVLDDLQRAVPVELDLPPGVYTLQVAAQDPESIADLDAIVLDARGNPVAGENSTSIVSLLQIVNVHPQVYRLVGWVPSVDSAVRYTCTVQKWPCDAEDFLTRQVVRAMCSTLGTDEAPGFDARTKAARLDGTPGSNGRCSLEVKIPKPGFYVAVGRVSAALPIAMTLADGGQPLNADTSPASGDGDAVRRQSPTVAFRVDRENATVRLACESAVLATDDGSVEITARVIGWPGLGVDGADGE